MARLVLVPTPIGNLSDISERAIESLKNSDLILCEDTRHSKKLLQHYSVSNPLRSFHQHNEHQILESTVNDVRNNELTCLISDAGTPGISDPGFLLVRACAEAGVEVICLPGPTAFVPALVQSGLPCDRFCFEGFLPHKKGRQTKLKELEEEKRTMVFYESPHRLLKSLKQMSEHFGDERKASVSREISKIHEETIRGSLSELTIHFEQNSPKGEFVIVVGGKY
jgi:16S rRNA (cytidine1402-2'-O)-methyltransferase